MSRWRIAQFNIATAIAPLEDPVMHGFMSRLAEINAVADGARGFVWRLQTEEGDSTALRVFADPNMLINLSVWDSVESLREFTYAGGHVDLFRERRQWFKKPLEPILVLWWVSAGELPTIDEAKRRLDMLRSNGPSPEAFTFAVRFDPPLSGGDGPTRS